LGIIEQVDKGKGREDCPKEHEETAGYGFNQVVHNIIIRFRFRVRG
jgi:hypothetical protein